MMCEQNSEAIDIHFFDNYKNELELMTPYLESLTDHEYLNLLDKKFCDVTEVEFRKLINFMYDNQKTLFATFNKPFSDMLFSLSLTENPLPYNNDDIEVKQSTIHGNGVFAKRDIPKDNMVTIYPTQYIYENIGNLKHERFANAEHFDYDHRYAIKTTHYHVIGDPTRLENMMLVGHILNDSACNFDKGNYAVQHVKNIVGRYILSSDNNCAFKEIHDIIYLKAIKDIKKDDELFVSYGPGYWMSGEQNLIFKTYVKDDKQFQKFMTRYILK